MYVNIPFRPMDPILGNKNQRHSWIRISGGSSSSKMDPILGPMIYIK